MNYLTIFFSASVAAMCILLILHPAYRNRLVRLCGLSIIAIVGFARAGALVIGDGPTLTPLGVLLWLGLFLFFLSHVCSLVKRFRARHSQLWYSEKHVLLHDKEQ